MPRNTAGTYTAPSGNPVSAGSVIRSSWANGTVQDIGGEITNSLSRDGYGAMRAPLKVPDGSNAAPTYTFANDPDSGTFLQSAGHVGMAITSTLVQLWTAATTAISNALTVAKGLAVTNSTTNGAGTTSTGNGTGAGVVATGGATGNGGTFAGGATSGYGAQGTGGPGSAGVRGVGGSNAAGLLGAGTGSGAGVSATGGATGVGGSFTGGATGDGLIGLGGGSGKTGVVGTGGAGGAGVIGVAGTAATATVRQAALAAQQGDIVFTSSTNPDSTVAITNTLTPGLVVKAWGIAETDGASNITLVKGQNISSVSLNGNALRVTMAAAMDSTDYAPVPGSNSPYALKWSTVSSTVFDVLLYNGSAVAQPFGTQPAGTRITFHVMGLQ